VNPIEWHKFILGAVQGLGEFLPISSSAHLILVPRYFGWEDGGLAFDVALHLGTLLAVTVYFWKDLWQLVLSVLNPVDPGRAADRRLVGLLILATVPGAIIGLALEHRVETVFRSPHFAAPL
jgi:undecaprenyl-diphosphatase